MGEVGVDDHRIGRVVRAADGQPGGLLARRRRCARPRLEADLDAEPLATRAMASETRAAAALDVPDAVLVFQEAEDGEQARAAERRHPQVFGLEGEGEPHQRVAEMPRQVLVHRAVRPQQRQVFSTSGWRKRKMLKGFSSTGRKASSLARFSVMKRRKPFASSRAQLGDLGFHPHRVGRRVEARRRPRRTAGTAGRRGSAWPRPPAARRRWRRSRR